MFMINTLKVFLKAYFFSLMTFLVFTDAKTEAAFQHQIVGPKVLTNEVFEKLPMIQKSPASHNGLAVTDYFGDFDLKVTEPTKGCFRPVIKKWNVKTFLYVRPKMVLNEVGRPVLNHRWSKIENHGCRLVDPDFNTWEGTLLHEREHGKARDLMLKSLWKELQSSLKDHCSSNYQAAQEYVLNIMQTFIAEVQKADTEDRAELLEAQYYTKEYERKTKTKCGDFQFIRNQFPNAEFTEKSDHIEIKTKQGLFIAKANGITTVVSSSNLGVTFYFIYGSLIGKEVTEVGEKVRYEYNVDGSLKHKIWISGSNITAKAWAGEEGELGSKVSLVKDKEVSLKDKKVAVIDTGYESTDYDGHGTFVKNLICHGCDSVEVLKVSTDLDSTLWNALEETKKAATPIVNISIGEGMYKGGKPRSEASVKTAASGTTSSKFNVNDIFSKSTLEKTCSLVKEVSEKSLVIIGAGNDGTNIDSIPFFPAACDFSEKNNVIVVGSFDTGNHTLSDFGQSSSNYSNTKVHVLTAHGLYKSSYPGNTSFTSGGTSFSAAAISKEALKLLQEHPSMSPADLKSKILSRCKSNKEATAFSIKGCVI